MSVTEEIKSRLDIVDLVSEYVQLRKSGRNFAGFCPFHNNTRTPAFYVSPEKQTWRCFGACAEGGDIFSFVMKKEGWEFKEALEHLAQRAGVKLERKKPKKHDPGEDRLADLLEAAADYFHQLLLHAPQAEGARRYVEGRGLSEKTLAAFRIGFSLNSWDACRTHFNAQGYSDQELLEAGLLTENEEKQRRYDRFRNRLMFAIQDINGRVVGFGARTLEKDGIPKYLNSPQTSFFDKSKLLYGLDKGKRQIREARQAVIVEGYMDVIQAHQAGFGNVVAQMGTALTEQQLLKLKRYTKQFVLALDADAAGQKATLRSLDVARETLDREMETRFDARGLVRHEGRLKADIRVVKMPDGEDPDSIIRADVGRWPKLLATAQPIVAYVIEVAAGGLDKDDAKGKSAVAQRVLPLIRELPDPIERSHYRQLLAKALGVDERTLRQVTVPQKKRQSKGVKRASSVASQMPPEPDEPPWEGEASGGQRNGRLSSQQRREANFLRYCIEQPQLLIRVNRKLAESDQPLIGEYDFSLAEDKVLLRHIYQLSSRRAVVTVDELCDSLDDDVLAGRVRQLCRRPKPADQETEKLQDKLVLSLLDWRLEKTLQLLRELNQLAREAERSADETFVALYEQPLRELPNTILKINKAKGAMSAVSRRKAQETTGR